MPLAFLELDLTACVSVSPSQQRDDFHREGPGARRVPRSRDPHVPECRDSEARGYERLPTRLAPFAQIRRERLGGFVLSLLLVRFARTDGEDAEQVLLLARPELSCGIRPKSCRTGWRTLRGCRAILTTLSRLSWRRSKRCVEERLVCLSTPFADAWLSRRPSRSPRRMASMREIADTECFKSSRRCRPSTVFRSRLPSVRFLLSSLSPASLAENRSHPL
jgi:hypothetical protein